GVADWSFSSSATRPRQKSLETTSVGLKCVRAKVDLPLPEMPTRTTRPMAGTVITVRSGDSGDSVICRPPGEDRHLRGTSAGLVYVADATALHVVAVGRRDAVGPLGELLARPLEAVVGVTPADQTLVERVV